MELLEDIVLFSTIQMTKSLFSWLFENVKQLDFNEQKKKKFLEEQIDKYC